MPGNQELDLDRPDTLDIIPFVGPADRRRLVLLAKMARLTRKRDPMHSVVVAFLQCLYILSVLGLALYGFHAFWMTWHACRNRRAATPQLLPLEDWPRIVIQLPIFNEQHVVSRLLKSCMRLDYPADKLQIQILDDSDDATSTMIQVWTQQWQKEGHNIVVIHRQNRHGFKAGALANAMPCVQADFVAMFDADFEPNSDFLMGTVPHFLQSGNEDVGFVQARWGHLNRDYSPLTRAQALALDGHFVVEQSARQAAGYPFGFNGSAGVWRRACIEDLAVGGWQADTLCEDLDLSYRAQLAGWRGLYLNNVEAPAEIPPQLAAFKRQQFRWAKGSVQTLRKLAGRVWCSDWPLLTRLLALFHLGNYLIHPLLLTLLLLTLPLTLLGITPAAALAFLSVASVGPPLMYAISQMRLHPQDWFRRWAYLPLLMLLGTGLCLNNTIAVYQGLFSSGGEFLRTPKFHVQSSSDRWQQSGYRLPLPTIVLVELGCALYALAAVIANGMYEKWWSIPFLLIYVVGFGLMGGVGLWQAWRGRQHKPAEKLSQISDQKAIHYKSDQLRA